MAHPGGVLKCKQKYDANIPLVPFHQYLMEKMELYGDRVAVVDAVTKEETTHSEMLRSVRKLAAALQRDGLAKGHYVAIALPNCVEFTISVLAVSLCGAVAAFVNPVYTARELEHVASIIQPHLWICRWDFVSLLKRLNQSKFNTNAAVIGVDASQSQWHSLLQSGDPARFVAPIFECYNDVCTMPFSSGTTGLPKGVMLTHHNLVAALCQFKVWCPYDEHDVNLAMLPMFHQYGCLIVFSSIATGSKIISVPKFNFTEMLQIVQDYQVTAIPLVPPIAILLTKHPAVAHYDLSSLRCIISSAAPISAVTIEEIIKRFKCDVLQGYGMTECTLATHFTPKGEFKLGSVGMVMPFYEAKIVNEVTGAPVGVGELGELCVSGPMIMKGYRGYPAQTAAMIDADGWLHTGDIGYYDQQEWFYIVDRLKELIKYKGLQVAPSELEHLLLTHPQIADAAVIGLPDEMAGELPRAFVVKKANAQITEAQVAEFINAQVAPFKKLRGGVVFVSSIPKLASGKILRRELKKLLSKV